MSIYVIGDLHLSFHEDKPMSIFGENWEGHEEKIKKDWIEKVKPNDIVVLPGDFSWSTYLNDTYEDFSYLNALPGKKILLKGNHDYWWTTVTNMKNYLKENKFDNIDFLYNNSYEYENLILVGTRGWCISEEKEDKKLLKREALRLELSIQDGIEKYINENQKTKNYEIKEYESETESKIDTVEKGKVEKEIIVFMHYPPITLSNIIHNETNDFIEILQKYNIKRCYYGHLHSASIKEAIQGEYFGIEFKLVSCDGLDFKLLKVK